MRNIFFTLFFIGGFIACTSEAKNFNQKIPFDSAKWSAKKGLDYTFRDYMVQDVLYNDTIRMLNENQIHSLLGTPDYIRENHHYYRINETRIGSWILRTKTMVVKFENKDSIAWIKIHE